MQAMMHIYRHDVYPAIGHGKPTALQIEFEGGGKFSHVPINNFFQGAESRRHPMKVVGRRIGSKSIAVIFLRPMHTRYVQAGYVIHFG